MKKSIKQPLVSVIIPVYNAQNFLTEAIVSVIKQTYQRWELIIIDDASTDKSWRIISGFKRQYPRKIKALRLKKNLNKGGDAAANVAFTKVKGELVARMDADDIACPERLEKQVDFLQKNPRIFMVGSQAWVINKEGDIIGEKKLPLTSEAIYENYFIFHPMIHPTIMLRRKEIKRKNLYKIKYSANNDLLTFLGFLKNKKFANLPDKLLYYRFHGKNDSLTFIKNRYFNTLKIRFWAIKELQYKPNIKTVLLNFIQFSTVVLLPEKALLLLYLLARGIYTPKELVLKMKSEFKLNFTLFKQFRINKVNTAEENAITQNITVS